jgi:hypothetical protein
MLSRRKTAQGIAALCKGEFAREDTSRKVNRCLNSAKIDNTMKGRHPKNVHQKS